MGTVETEKAEASAANSSERREALSVVDRRTGKSYELPIVNGTIRAMDFRQIKDGPDDFGLMTYDPAYLNTASCTSRITYIDGDKGILRYRGYPIEELAEKCTFLEVAYLLLHGELPGKSDYDKWVHDITYHTMIHENMKKLMDAFNHDAHPMGMLIATVAAMSTFYPEARDVHDAPGRTKQIHRLIAKMPTIAAFAYRHSMGMPYVYPYNALDYGENFLTMLFKTPGRELQAQPDARARARRALHPPRRPRAELRHRRDARHRLARTRIRTRRSPARPRRSTARSTAARTRQCCGC